MRQVETYVTAGETVLSNVAMQRMLLFPPSSSWPFFPAAYRAPLAANATLTMTNCTITTLCRTVSAYLSYMNETSLMNLLEVS